MAYNFPDAAEHSVRFLQLHCGHGLNVLDEIAIDQDGVEAALVPRRVDVPEVVLIKTVFVEKRFDSALDER